jgi:catechol 2,3-dioxygenase-like lactoylglutathione lyase family enzyme
MTHIALQYRDKQDAETFFCKILGLNKEKEFTLSADLAESIFDIKRDIDVIFYSNKKIAFEIFFTEEKAHVMYEHICLTVEDRQELIGQCMKYGIKVINIKRKEKTILFVRDFNGYLYEIKETENKVSENST